MLTEGKASQLVQAREDVRILHNLTTCQTTLLERGTETGMVGGATWWPGCLAATLCQHLRKHKPHASGWNTACGNRWVPGAHWAASLAYLDEFRTGSGLILREMWMVQ